MGPARGPTATSVQVPFAQTMSAAGQEPTCPVAPSPSVPSACSSCVNGAGAQTTVRQWWRFARIAARCRPSTPSMCFEDPNPCAVTVMMSSYRPSSHIGHRRHSSLKPPPSLGSPPRSTAAAHRQLRTPPTVSCGTSCPEGKNVWSSVPMPPKRGAGRTAQAKGAKRTVNRPAKPAAKKKNNTPVVRRSGRLAGNPVPVVQQTPKARRQRTRPVVSVTPQDAPVIAELTQAADQVNKHPRDNCALTRFVEAASKIKGHARTVVGKVGGKKALFALAKIALLRKYPFLTAGYMASCYVWTPQNRLQIYAAAGTVLGSLLYTEPGQEVLSALAFGAGRGVWTGVPKMYRSFGTEFQSTSTPRSTVLQNLFTAHGGKFGVSS